MSSERNTAAPQVGTADAVPIAELAVSHKIVLIIHPDADRGMAANRAIVLGTGLSKLVPQIIGPDLVTADGVVLPGFTQVPIPILVSKSDVPLRELAERARQLGCLALVYLARAQGLRSYEAYRESVAATPAAELDVDAVLLFGRKPIVNKLVGSLACLR